VTAGHFVTPKSHYSAGYFGYGAKATKKEIAGWDIDVRPDGKGLPPGHGSVEKGGDIFQQQCAACHGAFGEGEGRYPKLAGGFGTLTDVRPDKTVGSYWPYATTLWSYVHKAMPFYAPESLTPNQTYAIVAYILNLNNIVPSSFVANKKNLPQVRMPNRNGFYRPDPRPDTHNPVCLHSCRTNVKITSSAAGKNLTPSTTGKLDESLTH
jgi:cytochrome c